MKSNITLLIVQTFVSLAAYFSISGMSVGTFLIFIGVWNTVLFVLMLINEIKRFKSVLYSPVILFLINAVFSSGLSNIYLGITQLLGYAFLFGGNLLERGLFPQAALLVMLDENLFLLFYYTFMHFFNSKKITDDYRINTHSLKIYVNAIVLVSFLITLCSLFFNISAVGMFDSFLLNYNLILSLFFLIIYKSFLSNKDKSTYYIIAICAMFYFATVLFRNTKEDFIMLFMPFLLYLKAMDNGTIFSHKTRLFVSILFLYFIISFVFPYISIARESSDLSFSGDQVKTNIERTISANTPGTQEFYSLWDIDGGGYGQFLRRIDLTSPTSFSLDQVKNEGYIGYRFVIQGLVALVPRIFWHDKPIIRMGAEMDSFIRGGNYIGESGCSICLGMSGNAYIQGGIFLVVLSCLIHSFCVAFIYYFSNKYWNNPIVLCSYFIVSKQAFRHFESNFDIGLSLFIPMLFIYLSMPLNPLLKKYLSQPNQPDETESNADDLSQTT